MEPLEGSRLQLLANGKCGFNQTKRRKHMKKKLVLFCFALLVLGGLLAVPARVAAGCPTSCPCGYPNILGWCQAACANAGYGEADCYYECLYGCSTGCEELCHYCGMCC
jgi:hypothetical protein